MNRAKVAVCLTLLFLVSCQNEWPGRHSSSFILEYGVGELEVRPQKAAVVVLMKDWTDRSRYCSGTSDAEWLNLYDSLCIKHRDTSYDKKERVPVTDYTSCFYKDFVSIQVISKQDFDVSHPAGTSLSDILYYDSLSAYYYIESGYEATFSHFQIHKNLDEVTSGDMTLLPSRSLFCLSFKSAPISLGAFPLTITLTADDGMIYEFETEVFFQDL